MEPSPSVADTIAVAAGIGVVIGAFIGLVLPAATARRLLENVTVWGTLGGIVGTAMGFAIWAALALDGAVS